MKFRFLDLSEVLEIHESRIELYGGTKGVRDLSLLQSAVAQPQAGFGGEYVHSDVYEMAAAYLFHIARNHPFLDGNKRTALAACLVFLDFNDIEIDTDPDTLAELTEQVAQGNLHKTHISATLKKLSRPQV